MGVCAPLVASAHSHPGRVAGLVPRAAWPAGAERLGGGRELARLGLG